MSLRPGSRLPLSANRAPLHASSQSGQHFGVSFFNNAQLIPCHWVDTIDRPEKDPRFRQIQTMEVKIPVKKTFLAVLLALCLAPAAAYCAGRRSHCAAAPDRRAPRTSTASRMGLDRRLSPLGRPPLRLGSRLLGPPAASRRCLGAHHWEHRGDGWVLVEGHWR